MSHVSLHEIDIEGILDEIEEEGVKDEIYKVGIPILSSAKSTQSALSHCFTVLYTINYIDFKEILLINPDIYKLFQHIAQQRNKQIKQYDDQQLCQIITQQLF